MYQPKTVSCSSLVHNNSLVDRQHLDCGSCTVDPINKGNSLTNNTNLASKQRLRWTHELHERFVDAVAQLGGPDRKKPDKKETGDMLSNLNGSSGTQITEALKLQMEVQKRLHEQLEVQRQLQLRIEAQGKYLKKIIEEQCLSGVLAEAPGSGASVPALGDNVLESDKKTDPATPAPSSDSPLQVKDAKEQAPAKSHSIDESFSSHHEPLTPDSGCHVGSPAGSPKGERLMKKQMVIPPLILESSIGACCQQTQPVFMIEQFDPSSGMSIGNED